MCGPGACLSDPVNHDHGIKRLARAPAPDSSHRYRTIVTSGIISAAPAAGSAADSNKAAIVAA